MKILFLQKDVVGRMAIMLFSAILKNAGHQCDILVDDLERNIIKKALEIHPDVIAFSITTGEMAWMNKIGENLRKKFHKCIICGGPHPTFYPEVINEKYLDVICVGEGDEALVELLNGLEKGENITTIKNLIVKRDGKLYHNELRPLIADLDSLTFPDRSIYDKYSFYRDLNNGLHGKDLVLGSRGCPFQCSFCFNKNYKELYKGKGKYIRRRSVANLIKEIKNIKRKYPTLRIITFIDDVFTLPPRGWLVKFLERYKKEINIPFSIQTRADLLDEEMIKRLKEANCFSIIMGIEAGNEYIRNNILKKGLTDKQILQAAYLIKKYGIKLQTFNIVGIPGETLDQALETYEVNRKIHPVFPWCANLFPYPGTDIYRYARENNYLDEKPNFEKMKYSIFMNSPLKLKHKKELFNLQNIFSFCVSLRLPTKIVRFLIKLPLTPYYRIIFGLNYLIGQVRIHNARLAYAIKVALFQFTRYIMK